MGTSGDNFDTDGDPSNGIQPVTGINVNGYFTVNDALNKARKDIKSLCP